MVYLLDIFLLKLCFPHGSQLRANYNTIALISTLERLRQFSVCPYYQFVVFHAKNGFIWLLRLACSKCITFFSLNSRMVKYLLNLPDWLFSINSGCLRGCISQWFLNFRDLTIPEYTANLFRSPINGWQTNGAGCVPSLA